MYPVRFKKHRTSPFNLFLDDFFNRDWDTNVHGGVSTNRPAVNIRETGDAFLLDVSAPGFAKDAFEINVDKNLLTISGRIADTKVEAPENEKWSRREFRTAEFKRSFKLPDTIDTETIGAIYENGILSVTLPKKTESVDKPARSIDIK